VVNTEQINTKHKKKQGGRKPSTIKERHAKKGKRRRYIDPTMCERDYTSGEIELMKAMDQYKREYRRPFPTWSEVLEVMVALGYRKVAEQSQILDRPKVTPRLLINADPVQREEKLQTLHGGQAAV
jgi:hypothetical protein